MNQSTDLELVQETLGGSPAAFLALYDRYAPLVRASCTSMTQNLDEGQELAQETFVRAYTKLRQLHDHERFGAWLMGIARNVCRQWRKKRRCDRHRYAASVTEDVAVEDTAASRSEDNERLYRAIGQLRENERLAVQLFYLEEEPCEKAMSVLKVSRSGFYRLLDRGKRRLARILSQSNTSKSEEGVVS